MPDDALIAKLALTGIIVAAAIGLAFVSRGSRDGEAVERRVWSIGPFGFDLNLWPLAVRRDGRLRRYAKIGLWFWFGVMIALVWATL